jgi:hypothetical protein
MVVPGSATCVTLDVTADVQAFVDGSSNFGWRLCDANEATGNNSEAIFGSRDGSSANQPHLDVVYLPP